MQVLQETTQQQGTIRGTSVVVPAGTTQSVMAGVQLDAANGPYMLVVQERTAVPGFANQTQARGKLILQCGMGGSVFSETFDIGIGRAFPLSGLSFAVDIRNEGTVTATYNVGVMRGSVGSSVFTFTRILELVVASNVAFNENTLFPIPAFAVQMLICPDSQTFPPGVRVAYLGPGGSGVAPVVGPVFDVPVPTTDNVRPIPIPSGAVQVAFNGGADFTGGAIIWYLAN